MTPIKDDLAILTAKIRANTRVDLYDKNYLHHIKLTFPLLLLTALISLSLLFFIGSISQTQLMILSLVSIAILLVFQVIAKRARIAALKGDTIILRGINSKSTVTSINSIKAASSFRLFGVQVTRLTYILDHQKRSSLIFGAPSGMNTSMDQLIRHAKKCKKIKGKS